MLHLDKMKVLTTVAVATLGVTVADAQEPTLAISPWAAPTHGVNSEMIPCLIQRIEKATEGRITAETKYNLAPPPAQADIVSGGIADISWIAKSSLGYGSDRCL